MLPSQSERQNEGKSGYETYWEQNAADSHLSLLSGEKRVRHELCSSGVALLHLWSRLLALNAKETTGKFQWILIAWECLSQQDTPKEKYNSEWQGNVFNCDMGPGRWCGQIKVHYHACAATCAHPAVSIPSACNGFGALHSKNSGKVSEQPYTSLWDVEVRLFSGERGYGLRFKAAVTQRRLFQPRQWCVAGQWYPLLWPVQW